MLVLGCNRTVPVEVDRTEFAFGSYVRVRLLASQRQLADSAVVVAFRRFHSLDTLWSTFLEAGDVSRMNKAGRSAVHQETRELIETGKRFGDLTGGALDITVEPLLEAWGFRDTVHRVPDSAQLALLSRSIDYRRVAVERDSVFIPKGMGMDLGALAVGKAVDDVVGMLEKSGVDAGLVDAGGDIRVFGDRDWRIGVRDPRGPGVIRVLVLRDQAVSTSGDYQKFFESDGRRYCHIMDPRTGQPATACASVTVVAPSTLTADAWSTALFVLGPPGLELLAGNDTLAAVMYCQQGDSLVESHVGELR
jgi:thiamine biosynthesis lipoprotein